MNEQAPTPVWRQLIIPVILLIIFVFAIWGIINLQNSMKTKPKLDVSLPDISTSTEGNVNLGGKVAPGSKLTVNDKTIPVDDEGNFTYLYTLSSGENKLTFKVTKGSESATVEKIVNYTPASVAAQPEAQPVSPVAGADGTLASSGPAENIALLGLVGIIFSGYLYHKSRSKSLSSVSSSKIFTEKTI